MCTTLRRVESLWFPSVVLTVISPLKVMSLLRFKPMLHTSGRRSEDLWPAGIVEYALLVEAAVSGASDVSNDAAVPCPTVASRANF